MGVDEELKELLQDVENIIVVGLEDTYASLVDDNVDGDEGDRGKDQAN